MNNYITTIAPYKFNGQWVFDDPTKKLKREAFVAGSDTIIEKLSEGRDNVILLFSDSWFPDSIKLTWQRAEKNGNWYHSEELDMSGWLCPALLKYFDEAPKELYALVKLNG